MIVGEVAAAELFRVQSGRLSDRLATWIAEFCSHVISGSASRSFLLSDRWAQSRPRAPVDGADQAVGVRRRFEGDRLGGAQREDRPRLPLALHLRRSRLCRPAID